MSGETVLHLFAQHAVNQRVIVLVSTAIMLCVLVAIPWLTYRVLFALHATRKNYKDVEIPTLFGVSIVLGFFILYCVFSAVFPNVKSDTSPGIWMFVISLFGAVGLIDDVWGDKKIKGIKGHFRAAFRDHRITTGIIKAISGIAIGVCAGLFIYHQNPVLGLLSGAIVALSANALNLFDLRPGRATGCFLCTTALLLVAAYVFTIHLSASCLGIVFVMLPAISEWVLDSRAKVMLGDVGSNVLGASLGLLIVLQRQPIVDVFVLMALLTLHYICEKRSLTQIIAGNQILSRLDRLTGVRN